MSNKKVNLLNVLITDYKGITALDEEVKGKHFIVFGRNEAGKTTVLEAINRSALRIDPKDMADVPIRMGAKNATFSMIYLVQEAGGTPERILITNKIVPSGQEMSIVNLDKNETLKPPVTKIRELLGDSFDMTPLMEKSGKDQIDFLFKALGGTDIFDNILSKIKSKKDQKSTVNIRIKDAQTSLDRVGLDHRDMMDHRTLGKYSEKQVLPIKGNKTESVLLRKLAAEKQNDMMERTAKDLLSLSAQKAAIEKQIKQLQGNIKLIEVSEKEKNKAIKDTPIIDLSVFDAELAVIKKSEETFDTEFKEIERSNLVYQKIIDHTEKETALMDLEKQSKGYDNEIADFKQSMKNALTDLNLDKLVPGLDIQLDADEDADGKKRPIGLYYGELPLNDRQISYAKCIVILAILSSYVNAGKLNFIHIPKWSEMDNKNRRIILEFAEENPELNIQFGIEEVSETVLGVNIIQSVDDPIAYSKK